MPSFGYRSRLTRYSEIFRKFRDHGERFTGHKKLVEWVYRRYLELHPNDPKPVALRIIDGLFPTGQGGKKGAWSKPPPETIRADLKKVVYAQSVLE